MFKVFKCPQCGGSLSYEGGQEAYITCQFCNSRVMIPLDWRTEAKAEASSDDAQHMELRRLIAAGQKIQAIKVYRELYGVGLKEAKDAVDVLMQSPSMPLPATPVAPSSSSSMDDVRKLIAAKQKIQAIKVYHELTGVGLKEAKDAVEVMEGNAPLAPKAPSAPTMSTSGITVPPEFGEVAELIQRGATIEAIKRYRELTGVGLKEAKDAVDEFIQYGRWVRSVPARPGAGTPPQQNTATWAVIIGVVMAVLGCLVAGIVTFLTLAPTPATNFMPTALPAATNTPNAAQVDATSGAITRATREVRQATQAALEATASAQAARTARAETQAAEFTAQAVQQATATAQSAAPTLTAQAPWPVKLTDPFTNNRNQWHTGEINQAYVLAERRLANGQYAWDIDPSRDVFWSTWPGRTQTYTDFYASVDAHTTPDSGVASYGLVFRLVDEENYYYFGLYDDGYFVFRGYEDGQELHLELLDSEMQLDPTQPKRLSVSAVGPIFTLLINNQVVGVIEDERFKAGEIGLGMQAFEQGGKAGVVFDNLEIKEQ